MVTFIVSPPTAPQVNALTAAGVQHPLAPEVMAAVRQHGPAPIGLWHIINHLANARQPDYRARRRCWRLRYWGAVRELLKAKLMFRHRALIAQSDFATHPKPRKRDRGKSRPSKSLSE